MNSPRGSSTELVKELTTALGELHSLDGKIKKTLEVIGRFNPAYNWIGIYQLESNRQWLTLYPHYVGRPTEHTRIPVATGICGAAVREAQTLIVDDVKSDPRYLACSLETRSEIVVPIWKGADIIAEIDIDSDQLAAFTATDRQFLEAIAQSIGPHLQLLNTERERSL